MTRILLAAIIVALPCVARGQSAATAGSCVAAMIGGQCVPKIAEPTQVMICTGVGTTICYDQNGNLIPKTLDPTMPIDPGATKPVNRCILRADGVYDCTDAFARSLAPRSYHLLTITYAGTVTLLRDLTRHECEYAMHRAKGEPATDAEIAAAKRDDEAQARAAASLGGVHPGQSFRYTPSDGDMKIADCFK